VCNYVIQKYLLHLATNLAGGAANRQANNVNNANGVGNANNNNMNNMNNAANGGGVQNNNQQVF
jgi:hypothetical protein